MIFCNVFTFNPFVINFRWLNNLKYTVKRPLKCILYKKKSFSSKCLWMVFLFSFTVTYNEETLLRGQTGTRCIYNASHQKKKNRSETLLMVKTLPYKSLQVCKTHSLLYKMEGLKHTGWSATFLLAPKFHDFPFNSYCRQRKSPFVSCRSILSY